MPGMSNHAEGFTCQVCGIYAADVPSIIRNDATLTIHVTFSADERQTIDEAHATAGSREPVRPSCLHCGTHDLPAFLGTGRKRLYCSDACRQAAYRERS